VGCVAMTLVVRDEVDLIEAWLTYHLACGIDQIVVTDHRSVDGTSDILDRYESDDRVRVIRREDEEMRQAEWMTEMSRLAATEYDADWVIPSDADEFWWPRGGSVHELLDDVPARFGVVRGLWRHFVLRPDGRADLFERMTARCFPSPDFTSPYHAQVKIAHRGCRDVVVTEGNHDAYGAGLLLLREWLPFEVLHFPLRSEAQLEDKFARRAAILGGEHITEAIERLQVDGRAAVHRSHLVDDDRLRRGLEDGSLAIDDRLRDALAVVRQGAQSLPDWMPTHRDDVELALEFQVVLERDSWVGLDRRARAVERSIVELEGLAVVPAAERAATTR
jgi:Glycosyl transferase family 2